MTENCDHFVCTDCGTEVYSFPVREVKQTRCYTCQWLFETIKDPKEREELRKKLAGL